MDVSKYRDGRVHVRNSGVKWIKQRVHTKYISVQFLYSLLEIFSLLVTCWRNCEKEYLMINISVRKIQKYDIYILTHLTHIVRGKKVYFIVQQLTWQKRLLYYDILSNFSDVAYHILDVRWYNVIFAHEVCCKNEQLHGIQSSSQESFQQWQYGVESEGNKWIFFGL